MSFELVEDESQVTTPRVPLWRACLPLLFLLGLLSYTVYVFGDSSTGGAVQITLILAASFTALLGIRFVRWAAIQEGIVQSILVSLPAVLLLLLIGSLSGAWMISGIIPTIMYYGFELVHPPLFLVTACVVSAIVSLATGSSWSTVATVGLALIGIGSILDLNPAMVAGAVISGAYFGDKISPLSDTTNLASTVSGADLIDHIRFMLYTTVPSFILSLVGFLILGLYATDSAVVSTIETEAFLQTLSGRFLISPWLLLVPAVVIWLSSRRAPTLPVLLLGIILGVVVALIFQPAVVREVGSGASVVGDYFSGIYRALYSSVAIPSGNTKMDALLQSRGMAGMLNTVWLILAAMCFGGVMQATGFTQAITAAIVRRVHGIFGLVSAVTGSCLFFNITAADQFLAIVVPGNMFKVPFQKSNLPPTLLSRSIEDTGTVTSVLVPWNTCGATQAAVLQVATLAYLPFCFFNLLSPIMTLIYAAFNIKIPKQSAEQSAEQPTPPPTPAVASTT